MVRTRRVSAPTTRDLGLLAPEKKEVPVVQALDIHSPQVLSAVLVRSTSVCGGSCAAARQRPRPETIGA